MSFAEISHTADWSVRVWAEDLLSLFAESARAMNTLSETVTDTNPRVMLVFESNGADAESLLVAFLSELVYYQEQENLAFDIRPDCFLVDAPGDELAVFPCRLRLRSAELAENERLAEIEILQLRSGLDDASMREHRSFARIEARPEEYTGLSPARMKW